jgi:hypothetical protein
MAAADEVEELERRGWEALSGPDGVAFYADVMAGAQSGSNLE